MSRICLSVALQFALWDEERSHMAQLRKRWFDFTRPTSWVRDLILVPDRGGTREHAEGVWKTNRRAWERAYSVPGATHCWVWQEDMQPTPSFWLNLGTALSLAEQRIVVLLCARKDVDRVTREGGTWLALQDGTWGGATIMPRFLVREFLAWEERNVHPSLASADARVDLWMRKVGHVAYATVPSLLQHVGDRSVMGHSGVRQAAHVAAGPVRFKPTAGARLSRRGLNHRMHDYLLPKEAIA